MRLFSIFLLTLILFAPVKAGADDPIGEWLFDMSEFQAEFEAMLEEQLAALPEATRTQMRPMFEEALKQQMGVGNRIVVFSDDGTVTMQHAEGKRQSGKWKVEGNTLMVMPDDMPGEVLSGQVGGDTIKLVPQNSMAPKNGAVTLRRMNGN